MCSVISTGNMESTRAGRGSERGSSSLPSRSPSVFWALFGRRARGIWAAVFSRALITRALCHVVIVAQPNLKRLLKVRLGVFELSPAFYPAQGHDGVRHGTELGEGESTWMRTARVSCTSAVERCVFCYALTLQSQAHSRSEYLYPARLSSSHRPARPAALHVALTARRRPVMRFSASARTRTELSACASAAADRRGGFG
jgi:hypothetical protein